MLAGARRPPPAEDGGSGPAPRVAPWELRPRTPGGAMMRRVLITPRRASPTPQSPKFLRSPPFTVWRGLENPASSPGLHHPEVCVRSSPASYGSRGNGSESGRKTIGRERAGGDLLPQGGRLEQDRQGRADDGGPEPAEADRTEWQEAQVRKAAAGGLDFCERVLGRRPNRGCGSEAEPDGERSDQASSAASNSEALPNSPRSVSNRLCWAEALRPVQTQAAELISSWGPQASVPVGFRRKQ